MNKKEIEIMRCLIEQDYFPTYRALEDELIRLTKKKIKKDEWWAKALFRMAYIFQMSYWSMILFIR